MFRSGFIAILGRPNMGKSTLLNQLVGQKVAITSSVVQTTRHRIKGVVHVKDKNNKAKGQIVFLDTPGFSKAMDKLGEYLTTESKAALSEADCFVMVVDITEPPGKGDEWIAEQIKSTGKFVLLLLNKVDRLSSPVTRQERRQAYLALFKDYPKISAINISAKTGKNMDKIPDTLVRKLPEGPSYYDEESITDQRIREISAEIIREKVLRNTRDEIPHSVAIGIETFKESEDKTHIEAYLYVDQKSQKGMLIGKNGVMIKAIGIQARQEIQKMVDSPVHLDLQVRVKENWRKDIPFLKSLGLAPPKGS